MGTDQLKTDDRRKTKRRFLRYYARVFDAETNVHLGHLVDITPDGAMILTDNILPTGRVYRLNLEISHDVSDEKFLAFSAKVVWSGPDIDPVQSNVGFKILDITDEGKDIIRKIVEIYGIRDN